MNVTLFSDASLCSITGKGGWAAWLKSDEGTVKGGGSFRNDTIDTGIAEAMAAINGIHMGIRRGLVRPGCRLLIQTDNDSVWNILENRIRRKVSPRSLAREGADPVALQLDVDRRNGLIDAIVAQFRTMVEDHALEVRWRHVKGHRGVEDRRSAVNSYCDQVARAYMESARGAARSRRLSRRQRLRKAMIEADAKKAAEAASNIVPVRIARTVAASQEAATV